MPLSTTPELLRELAELYRRISELQERAGLLPGAGAPQGAAGRPGELAAGVHEALGELSEDVVAVLTPSGDILYVNSAAERLFGYRPDEVVGKNAWTFVHGEDLPAVAAARSTPLDDGIPLEVRVRCADGTLRWTELAARPWPAQDPLYVVARWRESGSHRGSQQPADEARRLAGQLRRAAALARISQLALGLPQISDVLAAAAALAPGALELDAGAYLEPDDGGLRVRAEGGFPAGTRDRTIPLVITLAGLAWAGSAPSRVANLQRDGRLSDPLLESGRFASAVAVPVHGKDRAHGVLLAAGRVPRHLDAEEVHFLETVANVVATSLDGRAAQERLAGRERLAQAMFEHAREGLAIVDDQGRIVEVNEAAARILGVSRDALRGRRPSELVRTDLDLASAAGEERSGEASVTTQVGPRTVEVERIPGIRPGAAMAVLRDVTERKDMLARLALADRLISAGTLAGGVAHELKTPLAYVTANLQFLEQVLRDRGGPEQEVREALKDAIEGTARLKRIVDDLRTFVRTPGADAGPADVEAVLRSCVGMTWAEIQARARLERSVERLPPVIGNPARLAQVFVNLLVNAVQAIPAGAAESNVIRLTARVLGSDRVAVEVSDSGAGITPAVLPHIFEPFFTTKGPGVGTGLGLSICRSIVEGLGGVIEVQSEPGRGSTFRVILPVAQAAVEQPGARGER
jgi:PAS domain S-box-containing protein